MKSIFSIPIHDSEQNIIGILNIDTNKEVKDTKFYDPDYQSYAGIATDFLGNILQDIDITINYSLIERIKALKSSAYYTSCQSIEMWLRICAT